MTANLLYAEDDFNTRTLVLDQLKEQGYEVNGAEDGEEAIRALNNARYDIVLLDIRMPRKDGLAVLRHIKAQKLPCRVVMVTAVDDLSIAIEAMKSGANDYLTKPFSFNALVSSIERVLAR